MNTSVGTKPKKKQPALSAAPRENELRENAENLLEVASLAKPLQQALLALENACIRILHGNIASRNDTETRYWQQRFQNIATPVSLALIECKGPRRFHYHYRHRADDESVLQPVLEPNPMDMLAQVCRQALKACRSELVGLQDPLLIDHRYMLEGALQTFLLRHTGMDKQPPKIKY